MEDPIWIADASGLSAFVAALEPGKALALDSESDSLHHYKEKVCLVQFAPEGGAPALLDPLAVRDLAPLAPVLANASVEKILHGADYDISTLARDFGLSFAGIFDTMIADRFAGIKEFG